MNSLVKPLIFFCAAAAVVWLISSVNQALSPFVFAAVIAYITAPLAKKLETRMPPPAAATLIVLLSLLLLILVPFAFMPIVAGQVSDFAALLPAVTEKLHHYIDDIPADFFSSQNIAGSIGGAEIQKAINLAANWFNSSLTLLSSFLTMLLITPLGVFYFLRDRKIFGGELTEILPPHLREPILSIARDLDNVLGEFLRGQLIVMTIMGAYYAITLKLTGLPFAFTIGIISGLLTFIPYVGFILGITLATLVGIGYFDSFTGIAAVWLLMGIGTTVESVLITPRLVGERVGLHPLAVLLSLLVMGDLFGFVGVLAALPLAAVLLVLARHARRRYISSNFYGQQ